MFITGYIIGIIVADKFENLVHFVIHKSGAEGLSLEQLSEILWRIDSLAYRLNGETITGETYIKSNQFS